MRTLIAALALTFAVPAFADTPAKTDDKAAAKDTKTTDKKATDKKTTDTKDAKKTDDKKATDTKKATDDKKPAAGDAKK